MVNIANIIQSHGQLISLAIISLIIFAESGIPVVFFLPGDTLLFTAGFFASKNYINIYALIAVVIVAKILGGTAGYFIGDKAGQKLFTKKDSLFFKKEYLLKAEKFYEKNGGKTVLLGQFFPVARTFSPIVAGFSEMRFKNFLFYNFLGAAIWAVAIPLLGYWLGHKVTNIDKYILPIIILAAVITFVPALWHIIRSRKKPTTS